jgi:VanZ family protein
MLRRWLPVALWAVLIAILSTSSFSGERTGGILLPLFATVFPDATPAQLQALHLGARRLAHFGEYLILSLLLYRALRGSRRWDVGTAAATVALAGLYAISDEIHQAFVPGRTAASTDCLIDVAGAASGQALLAARSLRPN